MGKVGEFFENINPHLGGVRLGQSFMKGGGATGLDKLAAAGALMAPKIGAGVGASAGLISDDEGSFSKYTDYGTQAGGLATAGIAVANKNMRKALGPGALGALVGGALTTAITAGMQDDDAGIMQRAGVGIGSLLVGGIAGGGIGLGIAKFTKPLKKVA